MNVHIGELIEERLTERGMTKAEFSRRINTSRQNVSLILQKKTLDTSQLALICNALDYDFFDHIDRPRNPQAKEKPKPKVFVMYEMDAETFTGLHTD